jgi:hypothetical protein
MSMMSNKEATRFYERKGKRVALGDDGKPLRIAVSHPSKSGNTVHVKAVNFGDNYKGIDRIGRDMRTATLKKEWQPVK